MFTKKEIKEAQEAINSLEVPFDNTNFPKVRFGRKYNGKLNPSTIELLTALSDSRVVKRVLVTKQSGSDVIGAVFESPCKYGEIFVTLRHQVPASKGKKANSLGGIFIEATIAKPVTPEEKDFPYEIKDFNRLKDGLLWLKMVGLIR